MTDAKSPVLTFTLPGLPGSVCVGVKKSAKPDHVAFVMSSLPFNRTVDVPWGEAFGFAAEIMRLAENS